MAQSKWNIDLGHSGVNFSIRHMVISKVRGRFAKFTGVLNLDDENVTRSVVEATIDASSIDTGVEQRDAHLRSADFFDVEKYRTPVPEHPHRKARRRPLPSRGRAHDPRRDTRGRARRRRRWSREGSLGQREIGRASCRERV